jgi:hypothetical protein
MASTQPIQPNIDDHPLHAPARLLDALWDYFALAMGIPPFPFIRVNACAPEARGT